MIVGGTWYVWHGKMDCFGRWSPNTPAHGWSRVLRPHRHDHKSCICCDTLSDQAFFLEKCTHQTFWIHVFTRRWLQILSMFTPKIGEGSFPFWLKILSTNQSDGFGIPPPEGGRVGFWWFDPWSQGQKPRCFLFCGPWVLTFVFLTTYINSVFCWSNYIFFIAMCMQYYRCFREYGMNLFIEQGTTNISCFGFSKYSTATYRVQNVFESIHDRFDLYPIL